MPSLSQLRDRHGPLLLVDAASAKVQAGLLRREGQDTWAVSAKEAGIAIFQCIAELDFDLAAVRAFAFCDGPGSILGIRTCAMAIRAWGALQPRPVYRYNSLALVAGALGRPGVQVIADARRETWHRQVPGGRLERVPASALGSDLVMPEGFRHWTAPPGGVSTVPYTVRDLLDQTAAMDLFTATEAPDAFLHEEPGYKMWTPQIHRAP